MMTAEGMRAGKMGELSGPTALVSWNKLWTRSQDPDSSNSSAIYQLCDAKQASNYFKP